MDIPHLRYFVAVVDHHSFSKAAAHCHTSVSNISEQIQNFERRVGKVLLDRNRRRVVPTEAGEILLGHARQILAHIEKACQEVHSMDTASTTAGKTSVGVLMTIAPCFLVHVLDSFFEQFPKIQISVHETPTAQMLAMLDEGKLDMGITALPIRDNGFETEPLFYEEMLLALPASHPLNRKKAIYREDLESEKFILSKEVHCQGGCWLRLCRQNQFAPRIAIQCGHLATVQSLVAAGKGFSLIPQMAITEKSAHITYRHLEHPRPKRSIVIVTRNKRPLKLAAQQFLKHLRQVGKTFKLPALKHHALQSTQKPKA
jgi:LysR family hydrogen peroxide-inducible transcriptional activator